MKKGAANKVYRMKSCEMVVVKLYPLIIYSLALFEWIINTYLYKVAMNEN